MTVSLDILLKDDESDFRWAEGFEETDRDIRIGAQILRGTWRYDLEAGIPYVEDVFEGTPDLGIIRADYYNMLAASANVRAVQSLGLAPVSDRTLEIDFAVLVNVGANLQRYANTVQGVI